MKDADEIEKVQKSDAKALRKLEKSYQKLMDEKQVSSFYPYPKLQDDLYEVALAVAEIEESMHLRDIELEKINKELFIYC